MVGRGRRKRTAEGPDAAARARARATVGGLLLAAALATAEGVEGQVAPAPPSMVGVEAAEWMAGCWVAGSESDRTTREVWMTPDGGVMVGMARSVSAGRATGWEYLLLARRDGVLTYSALPSGQALTHFRLTWAEATRLRFEDPAHDFPQALEYLLPRTERTDSLVVRVFGSVEDDAPSFEVRYGREACPGGPD